MRSEQPTDPGRLRGCPVRVTASGLGKERALGKPDGMRDDFDQTDVSLSVVSGGLHTESLVVRSPGGAISFQEINDMPDVPGSGEAHTLLSNGKCIGTLPILCFLEDRIDSPRPDFESIPG